MAYEYMLRDYRVKSGEMNEWIEEWRTKVYPLRLKMGFEVLGAWTLGEDRFVWVLGYKGKKGDFEKANKRYYDSKERKAMKPDPARHLSEIKHWMMVGALPND
jgi:hypothetical protein